MRIGSCRSLLVAGLVLMLCITPNRLFAIDPHKLSFIGTVTEISMAGEKPLTAIRLDHDARFIVSIMVKDVSFANDLVHNDKMVHLAIHSPTEFFDTPWGKKAIGKPYLFELTWNGQEFSDAIAKETQLDKLPDANTTITK